MDFVIDKFVSVIFIRESRQYFVPMLPRSYYEVARHSYIENSLAVVCRNVNEVLIAFHMPELICFSTGSLHSPEVEREARSLQGQSR